MPLTYLPNGLEVWAPNAFEAAALYHEIFATRSYLQHGVAVADGDCVLDVGANVGLFSIFLARSYRRLRLLLFEPVPPIFELLERNASLHLAGSDGQLFRCGLAAKPGQAEFEFDRFGTFTATMRPDDVAAAMPPGASHRDWLIAALRDFERVNWCSPRVTSGLIGALSVPLLDLLVLGCYRLLALRVALRRRIFLRRVNCPLRTVSDVITEQRLKHIDLLKIDVEGSEHEVLRGIESADWPKIRQLVIEVHDVDGRVAAISGLLKGHGYRTTVVRPEWAVCELLGIYTIYAVRETGAVGLPLTS